MCRVVRYVSQGSANGQYPSVPRAAIVTEVDPDDPLWVGLAVINPTGAFFNALASGGSHYDAGSYDEARGETTYEPGSWHWPPRVPSHVINADG